MIWRLSLPVDLSGIATPLTAHAVPVLLPSALSFLLVPFYPEYFPPPRAHHFNNTLSNTRHSLVAWSFLNTSIQNELLSPAFSVPALQEPSTEGEATEQDR